MSEHQPEQTASPLTAWGRAGYVFYWGSMLAGVALGAFFAYAIEPLGIGWQIVFGLGAFVVCYLGGRAFRYVLAGR